LEEIRSDESDRFSETQEGLAVINDWPISLEATRLELQNAKKRLARYQAVLRLANIEIEQRNRTLFALMTFAHQASRAAKLHAVLKLALVQALDTIGAAVGAVILIDPDTNELTLGVHKGLSPRLVNILTGLELENGASALMPHLVAGDGALLEYATADDPHERLLLTSSHLTSLVSLPLQVGAKLIGTLIIGLQGKNVFKPSELCFLMALSQETALFLDSLNLRDELWQTAETLLDDGVPVAKFQEISADEFSAEVSSPIDLPTNSMPLLQPAEDDLEHLLAAMMEAEDEVQQHNLDLQTLNTISEMMNRTLDLKEILQCAVEQTQITLKTDAAWLYLINEKQQLGLRAHAGLSEVYVRGMQCMQLGDGLEGRVAAENKAGFVENISTDPNGHKIWVDKEGLRSLAAVPLTCPGSEQQTGKPVSEVVGVLAVGLRARPNSTDIGSPLAEEHVWSPRETRLLTSISNQVAFAINNARLYTRLQDSEISVRTGNEVLRTINDMLLEKNSFLDGFIQDDLLASLATASQILQHLQDEDFTSLPTNGSTDLTNVWQEKVATLQEIVSRLNKLATETGDISAALDSEFDKVIDNQQQNDDFVSSAKPIRLTKKNENNPPGFQQSDSIDAKEDKSVESENTERKQPARDQAKNDVCSKPMTFEDAIAAGLVPPHILNREMGQ
jgi:GAF domain-containing protein